MFDKNAWRRHIAPLLPIPTGLQPSGQRSHPIAAVIFDIYGTLFISASGDIGLSRKTAGQMDRQLLSLLREYGITTTPLDLKRALFRAIEQQHGEMQKCGIDYPEIAIDRIWMRITNWADMEKVRAFALEYELITNPIYPMPGLEETLAGCRQARTPLGIISNAQFYTPHVFEYFLDADAAALGFSNDLTYYSYQTGHAKPSPYMFLRASERLRRRGLTPEATLYVGNDMLNDIYPAQRAGFQTALFAGDQRSLRLRQDDPCCAQLKPDVVITALPQLVDHILS
jgi:putative hydrolase of the HAD superfamily